MTHAKKIVGSSERRKNSFAEMVLEKYGPPIVRKTRNMAQQNGTVESKKDETSRKDSQSASTQKE